ncbi:MAG: hypothetical protein FWF25_04840 [Propionibacteriaceae bacterium]|nr:hypothetical protein [Propionibacteriaceae bacterium]
MNETAKGLTAMEGLSQAMAGDKYGSSVDSTWGSQVVTTYPDAPIKNECRISGVSEIALGVDTMSDDYEALCTLTDLMDQLGSKPARSQAWQETFEQIKSINDQMQHRCQSASTAQRVAGPVSRRSINGWYEFDDATDCATRTVSPRRAWETTTAVAPQLSSLGQGM